MPSVPQRVDAVRRDGGTRPRPARADAAPAVARHPLLDLQARAGNAAVARLIQRTAVVQRQVTTTMGTPARDITQIPTDEIEEIIEDLEGKAAKTQTESEQLDLAKTYVRKREAAFALVDAFESAAPPTSSHFAGVDARDVASHLRTTIEEPHLIDQDQLAWCGSNTVLMVIARNDPVGYARYVTDLYSTGRGKLGGLDVRPGTAVKAEWTEEQIAEPADWIALGSLRDAGNWIFSATNRLIGFATFPGDITSWFAGYGVPKDKIVQRGGWISQTDAGDLDFANSQFDAGWNVLLWVHRFTLRDGGTPEKIRTFDIQNTHWVVMNGRFTQDPANNSVWCPVNTWGDMNRKLEASTSKISSSVFGFIAVDMNAQVRKPEPDAASPATAAAGRA